MSYALGIDIGATKIAYALVDRNGSIHAEHRLPTRPEDGPDAVLDRIAQGIQTVLSTTPDPLDGIGIGCPGIIDLQTGVVQLAVNLNWHDVPLVDGIKARLPQPLPVVLDNDVRVWAKAEMVFGTATDANSFIYIALGTGLGATAIINGQPLMGSTGSAMELGHIIVQDQPRRRAEEFIAGLGMMQLSADLVDQFPQSRFAGQHDVTTHLLLSHPNDPLTRAILDIMTRAFGQSLAWACTVLNPELIIVGGAFGQAIMPHIQPDLLRYIRDHTLPQVHSSLQIRLATITNGALGAACLLW